MANFDAQEWAKNIQQHKNPLIVAGEGCTQIPLPDKSLINTVISLSERLSCPIAATGNTIVAIKEANESVNAKKMWLAELFRYLEGDWSESLTSERPDLLLMIGYPPQMIKGMSAGAKDITIAHLGPGNLSKASMSMGEVPIQEWEQNLDALLNALT